MLEQVLRHIHNRFERDVLYGTFEVVSGTMAVDGAQQGQYLWIEGSVFNDGLHQYPLADLTDEEFTGRVLLLAVPSAVREIADRVADWTADHADVLDSPYQSESFGGYSYTRASGSASDGSSLSGWEAQFRNDLDPWRKMYHSGW